MNLPMSVVIDFSDAGDGTPRDARSGRALGCDAVFDRYTGKQNATDIHPAEYTGALKQSRLVHKSTSAAIARAAWSVLWQDPSATALGPRDGLSYDYLYRDLHQHQASVIPARRARRRQDTMEECSWHGCAWFREPEYACRATIGRWHV